MNEVVLEGERIIENAIMDNPKKLGYPGALSIRNWRVAKTCGRLDVGLLPTSGPKKLVLVEAKSVKARDAASKVVGQLLMYYAGALTLGVEGLGCLRSFAMNKSARDTSKKSLIRLSGDKCRTEVAWASLSSGKLLLPRQLSLYIALDDKPHTFLREMLGALRRNHGLSIGLIIVRNGRIVDVIDG